MHLVLIGDDPRKKPTIAALQCSLANNFACFCRCSGQMLFGCLINEFFANSDSLARPGLDGNASESEIVQCMVPPDIVGLNLVELRVTFTNACRPEYVVFLKALVKPLCILVLSLDARVVPRLKASFQP